MSYAKSWNCALACDGAAVATELHVGSTDHRTEVTRSRAHIGPSNDAVTQLRGQGPRAEVAAAHWLPRIQLDSDARSATSVTPRFLCSAEGLQPRAEAGPRQLQWLVSRPKCTFVFALFPLIV